MRRLTSLDKLILEGLETEPDFVEASQFIYALKLKNQILGTLAIDSLSELAQMGLIAVSGGTRIKITPLGRKTLESEGILDWEEKSKLTQ